MNDHPPTPARRPGEELPRLVTPVPGPASRRAADRLSRVESRNVTYLASDFPLFWEEARGGNVRDADGNLYLDLTGAFGVAVAGHAHPAITAAIQHQAERLTHGMGDVHPPAIKVQLLERLASLSPWGGDCRSFLANSGSEAVEAALKTALVATGKPGVVAFEGGYHGLTQGSLSATFREDFRGPFRERLFDGVRFVPFPQAIAEPGSEEHGSAEESSVHQALSALERAFDELEATGSPVGCVLVEMVQGRAGVRLAPAGFFPQLARFARDRGALLVADEVFTGFGRTGALFAHEHEGVVPDILCVGKALGGGLPLSACLAPRSVMDAWPLSTGEALHTSTFLGHPLACASALAFLRVLEDEDLVARSAREGGRVLAALRAGLGGRPGVREVRGRGLFIGIELEDSGAGVEATKELLRRGILVLPAGDRGEVVELSPPLVLTTEQLDFCVAELIRTLS